MRFLDKKTVILAVAVLTVFLLASSASRGTYKFPVMDRLVSTVLAPIQTVLANTGFGLRRAAYFTGEIFTVYRQNQALRAENLQLQQNNLNIAEIAAENARLRTMLDYKKGAPQFDFVTASVIGRDPGTWTNIIIINRGATHGIAKDMPVVTPQGLAGHVAQVYSATAKVQLLLDPRSAVGALVQRSESRVAAIVEGNAANPMMPRMVNLARDADVIKGDKIITSGFGGIYPKGLLVGEVIDVIDEEGGLLKYAVLKPSVDFGRLEEVFVITRSREPATSGTAPAAGKPATPKGAGQ